jgi:hypothetical protein
MAKRATKGSFSLRSLIFCDDARIEISGKETLVGVYGDSIIMPKFPAAIVQLVIRIMCVVPQEIPPIAKFRIDSTQKKSMWSADIALRPQVSSFVNLRFSLRGVFFEDATRLDVFLGFHGEPVSLGGIDVRLPENDEEKERLSYRT